MESHLDKIKKLLRLSKSSNVHEAEQAMKKAMEMATRHEIDLSSLEDDSEVKEIIHRWFPAPSRLAREWKMALTIAKTHFHITPCVSPARRQVVFVGRADAIEVADYIVTFLVRESRRLVGVFASGEKMARRRMTGGKRAGFITGFFTGIHSRLEEGSFDLMREDERYAIILASEAEKRRDALDSLVGKTTKVKLVNPRRSKAVVAGFISGRQTNLARPLAGDAPQQGMLLLN